MNRSTAITLISGTLLIMLNIQCSQKQNNLFLGSAVMEANTFQIATTSQGNLVTINKDEGDSVNISEVVAIVDTIPYILKRLEFQTGVSQLMSTIASKKMEISSSESDIAGIEREYKRINGLFENGAVPAQQRDNLSTQLESAKLRLDANRKLLQSLYDQMNGMQSRIGQINDQIAHCYLRSPSKGIVLTRFRNLQEVIGPGNPVYEIGSFDTLYADFFVPQPVLASISYGQKLRIRIDYDDGKSKEPVFTPCTVTWISNEAEFSPKNIQTRESRNELVFRIRVHVPNSSGLLKRGLPVEIWR